MKKKKYKRPIDMRHHRDVLDISPGGYLDTQDSLGMLLEEITSRKIHPTNGSKVIVYCSLIVGDPDDPQCASVKRIFRLGYLFRRYESMTGEEFNSERFNEKLGLKQYAAEKAGDRRAAWGLYGATVRLQNEIEADQKFKQSIKNLEPHEQKEVVEKRDRAERGKSNYLIIG